jgi:hypothetical protein
MIYNKLQYLLIHNTMTEPNGSLDGQNEALLPQQDIDPDYYLSTVLRLYRDDEADYRGRRNEDQQIIAEYAAEEADEHFDLALLTVMSLSRVLGAEKASLILPNEQAQKGISLGNLADGVTLHEMRTAWRQLWVGANILTNRLNRDSHEFQALGLPEIFEMTAKNKGAIMSTLFCNFQELNALRFGAADTGRRRDGWVPNPQGGRAIPGKINPDKARNQKEIAENAARRRYVVGGKGRDHERAAVHAAGKMTPNEFRKLRKQYPEVDMDKFAYDAAYLKDMAEYYEQNQE